MGIYIFYNPKFLIKFLGCVKLFSIPEVVLVVCDYVDKYVCDVAEVDYSASKATIEDDCCLEPKFYIRFKFQN